MITDVTPIRTLMNLRNTAHHRNDAVETATRERDGLDDNWAASSRIWSRQAEALLLAAIAEPPTNVCDVLSVLSCVAEMRHQHDVDADQSTYQDRDVTEMTDVAIQNCIVALARNVVPDDEYLESEIRDIDWSAAQVAHWLPKPAEAIGEASI